jgi:hypothetical protein
LPKKKPANKTKPRYDSSNNTSRSSLQNDRSSQGGQGG